MLLRRYLLLVGHHYYDRTFLTNCAVGWWVQFDGDGFCGDGGCELVVCGCGAGYNWGVKWRSR